MKTKEAQFEFSTFHKYRKSIIGLLKRLYRNKLATTGAVITFIIILTAFFAPFIAPHDPYKVNLTKQLHPPSFQYPFGTDFKGRCVFSRVIFGSRIALYIGSLSVIITSGVGILIGLISGFFGGFIDRILMRLTDVVWSFPPLVFALAFVMVLGAGIQNVIIAIAITSWAPFARVTRSAVQRIKNEEFVEAARATGESKFGIMFLEILPNVFAPNLVLATLNLPGALLTASAMSFLGLGAQPPKPEWGAILSDGREFLKIAPWISTYPGLVLMITVLAFNFLGDGLREALDPKLKHY
ncbi:MAG: ABC transporter permease [Candidatus Korarchaeota archaeon]|nr:ABC transporter permease [Candidatus Korarchaeota archaeon]NIU85176.1 ABC transporter permease subunit [Candidatus Thorarchaeota archaeon]NIW15265.1 ABC transporter permease subunit [Candidatus Thorarchaeota archaeon]NIW53237.1 ABC transporter permease subunit [Candidatus Korarchaeota archaeon]